MKAEGHPKYNMITVVMTDGEEYQMRTTWGKEGETMRLDVDPKSHPAWRGNEATIQVKGKVKAFEDKFGSFLKK